MPSLLKTHEVAWSNLGGVRQTRSVVFFIDASLNGIWSRPALQVDVYNTVIDNHLSYLLIKVVEKVIGGFPQGWECEEIGFEI